MYGSIVRGGVLGLDGLVNAGILYGDCFILVAVMLVFLISITDLIS